MQRIAKGVLWVAACLVVALVGAFARGRLRPSSSTQQHALAVLHENLQAPPGRNAFAALWLADFDVPRDQLDAAYAKDRARVMAWHAAYDPDHPTPAPQPAADFPRLPPVTQAERKALCDVRDADCLGKVRAHIQALQGMLHVHAKRLANDESLSRFDIAWNDMPKDPGAAMPPFNAAMGLWQTAIALDYVSGMQAKALDDACIQVATLRRLHAHSNSMVQTLVLASRVRGAVNLFTQLLAETPLETALPASCNAAFAPVSNDDVDLCPSMRAEFATLDSPELFGKPRRWYDHLHLSRELTQRLIAPRYAAVCEPAFVQKALADDGIALDRASPTFDVFDLVSNSAGVALSRVASADATPWLQSQQDAAASVRIGALILWLRDTRADGRSLPQRVAARPAWMRFGEDRQFELARDGRSLTMYFRHDPRKEWPHAWPLPVGL